MLARFQLLCRNSKLDISPTIIKINNRQCRKTWKKLTKYKYAKYIENWKYYKFIRNKDGKKKTF